MKIKTITLAAFIATLTGCNMSPDVEAIYICSYDSSEELAFIKTDNDFVYLSDDVKYEIKDYINYNSGFDGTRLYMLKSGVKVKVTKDNFSTHETVTIDVYRQDNAHMLGLTCQQK